jgi:nucleotide-binding universal stress UspA family protein
MKNILVPCDFSRQAIDAFRLAVDIASLRMGEVCVLHAIEAPLAYLSPHGMPPYSFDMRLIDEMETESRAKFEKMKSLYASLTVPVGLYLARGPVAPIVNQYVDELGVDLIIMGTHG